MGEGLDDAALATLRERYRVTVPSTHWHDCYQSHPFCAVVRLCDELIAARQRIAALEKEIPAWAAYDKTEGWNRDGLLAIGNALNAKDRRIAELEDALRQIAIAPCMYELLGEPETCQHSCPGCRARKALEDAATIAVTKEGTKNG